MSSLVINLPELVLLLFIACLEDSFTLLKPGPTLFPESCPATLYALLGFGNMFVKLVSAGIIMYPLEPSLRSPLHDHVLLVLSLQLYFLFVPLVTLEHLRCLLH